MTKATHRGFPARKGQIPLGQPSQAVPGDPPVAVASSNTPPAVSHELPAALPIRGPFERAIEKLAGLAVDIRGTNPNFHPIRFEQKRRWQTIIEEAVALLQESVLPGEPEEPPAPSAPEPPPPPPAPPSTEEPPAEGEETRAA